MTVLPDPDSPRIPSTSPRASRKLTPFTAWIGRAAGSAPPDFRRRRPGFQSWPAQIVPARLWPEPGTIMWQATWYPLRPGPIPGRRAPPSPPPPVEWRVRLLQTIHRNVSAIDQLDGQQCIDLMVEQAAAGEAPSSPQPPEAGARRARLYGVSSGAERTGCEPRRVQSAARGYATGQRSRRGRWRIRSVLAHRWRTRARPRSLRRVVDHWWRAGR